MIGSYRVYKTNEVSKDGCIEVVQGGEQAWSASSGSCGFDPVVDPVAGRKFAIGACLMSGVLAVFLEKHASLLQLDVSMRGIRWWKRIRAIFCTVLRRFPVTRPCAVSPGSDRAGVHSAGVPASAAACPARQGPRSDGSVVQPLSGGCERYRHFFLPTDPRSVLPAGPAVCTVET